MAEMYGRVTGRAAVCSATLGPGAINLLLGVADATTNSTPMVASRPRSARTASTRSPTRTSTWCPCSRRSPSGRPSCPPRAPYRRWSARRSSSPRPNARRGLPGRARGRRGRRRRLRPDARCRATSPAPTSRPRAGGARRRASCARRSARWCWPGTAPPAPARPSPGALLRATRHAGGHHLPRQGRVPRRPPQLHSAPSGSCATTTSTSASTSADVIISVGYELQEFDPVRINPQAGQADHPHSPVPGRGRRRTTRSSVGIIGDISASLDALAARSPGTATRAPSRRARIRPPVPRNSPGDSRIRVTRWHRSASWPTPARRWAATTSCWSTPVRPRCGWPASTRPTSPTPA